MIIKLTERYGALYRNVQYDYMILCILMRIKASHKIHEFVNQKNDVQKLAQDNFKKRFHTRNLGKLLISVKKPYYYP
jgi:transposase